MKMPRPGDRVRLAPDFLRQIAAPELKRQRGTIVEVYGPVRPRGPLHVRIQWDGESERRGALTCNIEII